MGNVKVCSLVDFSITPEYNSYSNYFQTVARLYGGCYLEPLFL